MLTLCIEFIIALFATGAFAVLFNVPKNQWFFAGLTGSMGWICYRIFQPSLGSVVATFIATLFLTLISRIFAVIRKSPVTVFLVSGIFPLVPGVGIYYTSYHFILDKSYQAGIFGMDTVRTAIAIALGIMFILSLPQKLFLICQRKN